MGQAVVVADPSNSPRLARQIDVPALEELLRTAYGPYLMRMDRPPAPMLRDMRPEVQAGHVWITGRPIRSVISLSPTEGALLIENVAVHPNAQGLGLGRQLMEFAEEEAGRLGFGCLRLYTNEAMTENLALYGRLGYHEVDRRNEDGYRRVFMEKHLGPG